MLLKEMTCEEYREQLREWREDGGRHSDEVRTNLEWIYFRESTDIFAIFFKISKTFQNVYTFADITREKDSRFREKLNSLYSKQSNRLKVQTPPFNCWGGNLMGIKQFRV